MKRIFALFLVLCLIFSLGACGDNKADDTEKKDNASTKPSNSGTSATEPSGTEPSGTEPSGTEPSGTEPSTPVKQTPITGKYWLYSMRLSQKEYDYEGLKKISMTDTYLQLNADGSAETYNRGQVQTDLTWDTSDMTLSIPNTDNTYTFSYSDKKLTVTDGSNIEVLVYLHETSDVWAQMSSAYDKLHAYIVANGQAQDGAHVYTVYGITMTANADGSIHWKYLTGSTTVEMDLLENSPTHTANMVWSTYTGTTTIDTATYTRDGVLPNFQCNATGGMADTLEDLMQSAVRGMFTYASLAMHNSGITIADLGFISA